MNQWVGLIGALGGVAIGGAISYFVNWQKFQYEKLHTLEKREIEKIEQAYELLIKVEVWFRNRHSSDLSYFMPDEDASKRSVTPIPFPELEMLFSLYIPALVNESNELIKAGMDYGAISVRLASTSPTDKVERNELFNELSQSYKGLNGKIAQVKLALSQQVRVHLE